MRARIIAVILGGLLFSSALLFAAHSTPDASPVEAAALASIGLQGENSLYLRAMADLEARLQRDPNDYEASLLKGLVQFKHGDLGAALGELETLTERAPKFHLAHLIRGDLLLARSHTISDIGAGALLAEPQSAPELERLRTEARTRLAAYLASFDDGPRHGRLPRALMLLGESVGTALLVDKASHRLYLFRRGDEGVPELVRDYYVSTGKLDGNKEVTGDLRTPEGVYFITSHIPQEKLPDKYGIGAWPMNYPNEWDQHLGKSGYGIWLHGTESAFYSRPPLDSEGCVVLPNLDLSRVRKELQPGSTPIIVTDQVSWLTREEWLSQRSELQQALESWRDDWSGGDVERYLQHYADSFWADGHNFDSWSKRKRRIARSKRYQSVELSDLSLFLYPERAADGRLMAVANFRQRYDSNNYTSDMRKRLYLTREAGQWQVFYEGRQ